MAAPFDEGWAQERIRQALQEIKEHHARQEEEHEREKRELRDQIANLQQSASAAKEACKKLREEKDEFVQKHADLNGKHENMRKQATVFQGKFEYYRDKYRASKGRIHDWQQWSDKATPPGSSHSRTGGKQDVGSRPMSAISEALEIEEATSKGQIAIDQHVAMPVPRSRNQRSRLLHQTHHLEAVYSEASRIEHGHVGSQRAEVSCNEPNAVDWAIHKAAPLRGAQDPQPLPQALHVDAQPIDPTEDQIHHPPRRVRSSHGPTVPSSQTTDDEPEVKLEPSTQRSSPPVVVYERPAPGRNPEPDSRRRCTAGEGTNDQPFLIKEESDSPQRLAMADYPQLRPEGTGDLDEQETDVVTPRKRRRLERAESIRRANGMSHRMSSNLGFDRGESMPHEMPPTEANGQVDPLQISFHEEIPDEREVTASDWVSTKQQASTDMYILSGTTDTTIIFAQAFQAQADVLSPLDPNQQILPRTKPPAASRKRPLRRDSDIRHFAEDGESFRGRPGKSKSGTVEEKAIQPRVQTLLEAPTSPNRHAVQTPNPSIRRQKAVAPVQNPQHTATTAAALSAGLTPTNSRVPEVKKPPSRALAGAHPRTPQTAPQPRRVLAEPNAFTPINAPLPPNTVPLPRHQPLPPPQTPVNPNRPPNVPLRSLSPSRLTLADFKINPAANDNDDYAYHETLRKAVEKACRPGCMDPNCCGNYWRKFAEMHYDIPPASPTKSGKVGSADSSLADHQLLVNYLGGGPWAQQRVKRMEAEARREMIISARADELAQAHGKHRQRFQRRRTPPGFWRADFPSTQERQGEGEEADKMRREMVRERWRDAVGGGGVWMFRDEERK